MASSSHPRGVVWIISNTFSNYGGGGFSLGVAGLGTPRPFCPAIYALNGMGSTPIATTYRVWSLFHTLLAHLVGCLRVRGDKRCWLERNRRRWTFHVTPSARSVRPRWRQEEHVLYCYTRLAVLVVSWAIFCQTTWSCATNLVLQHGKVLNIVVSAPSPSIGFKM